MELNYDKIRHSQQFLNTTDHSTSSTSSLTSSSEQRWGLFMKIIQRTKRRTRTDCSEKQARKSKFFPHQDSQKLYIRRDEVCEMGSERGQIFQRLKGQAIGKKVVVRRKRQPAQRRTLLNHRDSLKILKGECDRLGKL